VQARAADRGIDRARNLTQPAPDAVEASSMAETVEWQTLAVPLATRDSRAAPAPAPRPVRTEKQPSGVPIDVHGRIQSHIPVGARLRLLIAADHAGLKRGMTGLIVGVADSEFVIDAATDGYVIATTTSSPILDAEPPEPGQPTHFRWDPTEVIIEPSKELRFRLRHAAWRSHPSRGR
jgi:hypothetical protein